MNGVDIGKLAVLVKSKTRSTLMWEKSGDQGNKWIQAVVPIGHIDHPFQIAFTGSRRYSVLGDIAIDDIKYENCAYPRKLSSLVYYYTLQYLIEQDQYYKIEIFCTAIQSSCGSLFRCNRGSCVNYDRVCDLTDDCGDNSDEQQCSKYLPRPTPPCINCFI